MRLSIETSKKRQVIDITGKIEDLLGDGSGLANIFILHTTAAITTADLDPGTDEDLLDGLAGMIHDPPRGAWRHPHNPKHAPDHLIASIVGPGVSLPFKKGKLILGSWQRVVLVELDGPRQRELELSLISPN